MSAEDLSDDAIYASASEPARDDQGRFAAQERQEHQPDRQDTVPAEQERPTPNLGQLPDQEQQGAPEGEAQPQGQPPQEPQQSPRERGLFADLKGEREKRQKYESDLAARDRELAEMRGQMAAWQQMMQRQGQPAPQAPTQPQQAPDPYEDPQGFAAFQAQQVFSKQFQPFADQSRQQAERYQQQIAALSRGMAEMQHGGDAVKEAEEAFNTAAARGQIDPLEHQRINSSPNPYAAAVEWHRRQQAFTTTGGDPEKWFASELQRRATSDPAFQQQVFALLQGQAQQVQAAGAQAPAAGRQPPLIIPPSLNGAAGASARGQTALSDEDIFAAAPPKMGGRRA